MLKSLLISVNILGFLILAFTQKQDIKVTHNAPEALTPGEEVLVDITLDKSDVMGFAKFQFTLDKGLTAEAVEAAGASFTFNNGTGKFIWMALPESRKINMKIRLKAEAGAEGTLEFTQRFSYIYNNERKNFDAPPHKVMVGTPSQTAVASAQKNGKPENGQAAVQTERTLTAAGINQWRVEINIDKKNLSGFAKIEETVPDGYTVIDLKSSGAIFSVDNDEVKYIWYDFPEADRVTVSYKMLPVIAMEAVRPQIAGNFSFLQNDENVTVAIGDALGDLDADAMLAEEPEPEPETQTEPEPETETEIKSETEPEPKAAEPEVVEAAEPQIIEEAAPAEEETAEIQPEKPSENPATPAPEKEVQKPTEPAEERKTATAKAYTDGNIVDVPAPEEGVFYRVQIAAGKNNLSKAVFEKLYRFEEGFHIEPGGTWIKYTTGHFQVYKSARDDRERITRKYDKFQGPFVAAYNSGERITVQEALMVTNQKWVP